MQTWCLFNHRSTSFVLLSTRSAPLSQAGRGCWISSWTIEPAARQAEGGNKAPYCPPFHLKDGTNWLYKRHQRRVLLRVPITIESLGGRSENRKVMSVITAGVQALIRPNGLVLITREALRCLKTGSVFPQESSASSVFFFFFLKIMTAFSPPQTDQQSTSFYLLCQSSCPWPSTLADLKPASAQQPLTQLSLPPFTHKHSNFDVRKRWRQHRKYRSDTDKAQPDCYIQAEVTTWCGHTQHYVYPCGKRYIASAVWAFQSGTNRKCSV